MTGELLVVTGPPGAGKSTVAATLRAGRTLVSGDDFFAMPGDSITAAWLPGAEEQNTVIVTAAAGLDAMDYVVLMPSFAACLRRVESRVGHDFAAAGATRHMHREFEAARVEP